MYEQIRRSGTMLGRGVGSRQACNMLRAVRAHVRVFVAMVALVRMAVSRSFLYYEK